MLIVPYGWDQPDNAARVERLGVGLHLPRLQYSVESATDCLKQLLEDSRFALRASEVGAHVAAERALRAACDAIESIAN